tara:strand:+ start:66 stop:383 length:318 start_codon:yes stop_codon:yes gene_type:complete
MKQSVSIAPFTGYDGYGNASYGAAVDYEAAVVGDIRRVVNNVGQEVPSKQSVYLKSGVMVRPEDQITLSTSDVGSTESYAINPPILTVGLYPFGANRACTVIYLK